MTMFRRATDPTHQLLAFEAAARHLSVGAAAAELNSTPRSISQSIRDLEVAMGTHLFTRRHGGIGLTRAGEIVYMAVSTRSGNIGAASDRRHRATLVRAGRGRLLVRRPVREWHVA